MRKLTKLMSLALAVVMMLSLLAGCGGKGGVGGASAGLDVDPATLQFPLAETATIIISSVPLMILYPFFQKYFDSGIMAGAVKG